MDEFVEILRLNSDSNSRSNFFGRIPNNSKTNSDSTYVNRNSVNRINKGKFDYTLVLSGFVTSIVF